MRRLMVGFSLALMSLLFIPQMFAQQDQGDREREALRRRILQRVDAILAKEVDQIRHEIETLLDRELELTQEEHASATAAPPAEREHPDHPTRAEHPNRAEHPTGAEHPAKANKPAKAEHPVAKGDEPDADDLDATTAKETNQYAEMSRLFEESMAAHTAGRYDESIAGFKKLSEEIPDPTMKATAAYNVSCGYALKGDKRRAMVWLKKSIEGGFTDADHMLQDTDLESLRNLPAFKDLIEQARKANQEEGGEEGEGNEGNEGDEKDE